jgi:hypothetical protein
LNFVIGTDPFLSLATSLVLELEVVGGGGAAFLESVSLGRGRTSGEVKVATSDLLGRYREGVSGILMGLTSSSSSFPLDRVFTSSRSVAIVSRNSLKVEVTSSMNEARSGTEFESDVRESTGVGSELELDGAGAEAVSGVFLGSVS